MLNRKAKNADDKNDSLNFSTFAVGVWCWTGFGRYKRCFGMGFQYNSMYAVTSVEKCLCGKFVPNKKIGIKSF